MLGKTTILEAVDILSRGKSFRTNKTRALLKGEGRIICRGDSWRKRKKLEIYKSKSKTKIVIDGKEENRQSALAEACGPSNSSKQPLFN